MPAILPITALPDLCSVFCSTPSYQPQLALLAQSSCARDHHIVSVPKLRPAPPPARPSRLTLVRASLTKLARSSPFAFLKRWAARILFATVTESVSSSCSPHRQLTPTSEQHFCTSIAPL
eukprot:105739-Rhodomonas_salina.1